LDLYYGLMLPSGNDAGYSLASHFGEVLISNNVLRENEEDGIKFRDTKSHFRWSALVTAFLKEMNYYANKLGMVHTIYDSPHGLANPYNLSTANDQ